MNACNKTQPIAVLIFREIMIIVNPVDRLMELLPEETRLMHQVRFGDINAFVKLYDVYVERIHRYIYIQVVDDRAVEGLTFQTFFTAWKQLDAYRKIGLPFISWLYSIAQSQVNSYYRTHKNSSASVQEFLVSAPLHSDETVESIRKAVQSFTEEERQVLILKYIVCMPVKGISRLMSVSEGNIRALQIHALQVLAGQLEEKEIKIKGRKIQHILAECQIRLLNKTSTMDQLLVRHQEHEEQLRPLLRTVLSLASVRNVNPLPTFTAYTREALLHYMVKHPRRPQRKINVAVSRRMALIVAVLLVTFLVTGTAQAQSALPGEPLYSWKRASEFVWRAITLDLVSTDIFLAERRLDEWIAVADNSASSANARDGYQEVISRLQSASGDQEIVRILPVLQSQQRALNDAGLESNELNNYLAQAPAVPVATLVQSPPPTVTRVPPTVTRIPPTLTRIPPTVTRIPPTVTEIPPTVTRIPPTATEIPPTVTEIPPTVTEIPPTIEIPPTPIETQPPETEVPTELAPTNVPTFIPDIIPTDENGLQP